MSIPPGIDYQAVLADLENKKSQIEQAIAAIKGIVATASGNEAPVRSGGSSNVAANEFFGMSIPDAVKRYLGMVKQKQSTQDLIKTLEVGGMPPISYATIYAVLRRRQKQFGDIVNMKGDWGLAEWYPNFKFKSGKPEPAGIGSSDPSDEEDSPAKTDEEDADK